MAQRPWPIQLQENHFFSLSLLPDWFDAFLNCSKSIELYCKKLLSVKSIQDAALGLIFIHPNSPILRNLHWLPVAACRMMLLAFKAVNGTARIYLQHWSDHAPQREHLAPLHQLAGWYRHRWKQTKVTTLLCSGASVVEWTPDWCQDSRVTCHPPQKTQDSLVNFILTQHSMTPPPKTKQKHRYSFVRSYI